MSSNTLIIAIIVIVVIVSGIYIYQNHKKLNKKRLENEKKAYLPNHCPDYWDLVRREKDDKGREYSVCKNSHKLGLCALDPERNIFTFDDEIFVNPNSGDISKCKWSKQCGVSWTGYDKLCV